MKHLRRILKDGGGPCESAWKSIKLLEEVLLEEVLLKRGHLQPGDRLTALREIHEGRVKSGVHATGSKGAELATAALTEHGTYAAHFEYLCEAVRRELLLIEKALAE